MRTVVLALFALLAMSSLSAPAQARAQTLTPPEAKATLAAARTQATSISDLATANAPTVTPQPTATPWPTSTSTPVPTLTPTPVPTSTSTPEATPTALPTATAQPAPTATPVPVPIYERDDLPAQRILAVIVMLILVGVLLVVIRLVNGRTRVEPND